jgi:tetratricopeptide (TPR) repeat protein
VHLMWRKEFYASKAFPAAFLLSFLTVFLLPSSVFSDSPFLSQGISDYDKGDYSAAVGHFGEAASSDFNEPVLHYYMANAYVHLNQSESAIREFRIAYALAPQGEIGKLCKLGLAHYGMDSTGTLAAKGDLSKLPDKNSPRLDPAIEQALTLFRRKIEEAKISSSQQYQNQADAVNRRAELESEQIQRQTQQQIDDLQNNPAYRRSPTMRQAVEQQMRDDAARRIDAINKHYDLQRSVSLGTGTRSTAKIDESASNLEQLMFEKSHPGVPKLSPMGTNLYVRNYEREQTTTDKTATDKATTKGATKSISTPQPSKP